MPSWKVTGADQTGRIRRFKVNAETAEAAEAIARRNGITVSEVQPLDAPPPPSPEPEPEPQADPAPETPYDGGQEAETESSSDVAVAYQTEPEESDNPFAQSVVTVDVDVAEAEAAVEAEPPVMRMAPSVQFSPHAEPAPPAMALPTSLDQIPVAKVAPRQAPNHSPVESEAHHWIAGDAKSLMAYAIVFRGLGFLSLAVGVILLTIAVIGTFTAKGTPTTLGDLLLALSPLVAGFLFLVLSAGVRLFASMGQVLSDISRHIEQK